MEPSFMNFLSIWPQLLSPLLTELLRHYVLNGVRSVNLHLFQGISILQTLEHIEDCLTVARVGIQISFL